MAQFKKTYIYVSQTRLEVSMFKPFVSVCHNHFSTYFLGNLKNFNKTLPYCFLVWIEFLGHACQDWLILVKSGQYQSEVVYVSKEWQTIDRRVQCKLGVANVNNDQLILAKNGQCQFRVIYASYERSMYVFSGQFQLKQANDIREWPM